MQDENIVLIIYIYEMAFIPPLIVSVHSIFFEELSNIEMVGGTFVLFVIATVRLMNY